jgi:hypothetical protein
MAEQKKTLADRITNLSAKRSTIKTHFDLEGMTIQDDFEAIMGVRLFIDEMIKDTISMENDLYELEHT